MPSPTLNHQAHLWAISGLSNLGNPFAVNVLANSAISAANRPDIRRLQERGFRIDQITMKEAV